MLVMTFMIIMKTWFALDSGTGGDTHDHHGNTVYTDWIALNWNIYIGDNDCIELKYILVTMIAKD